MRCGGRCAMWCGAGGAVWCGGGSRYICGHCRARRGNGQCCRCYKWKRICGKLESFIIICSFAPEFVEIFQWDFIYCFDGGSGADAHRSKSQSVPPCARRRVTHLKHTCTYHEMLYVCIVGHTHTYIHTHTHTHTHTHRETYMHEAHMRERHHRVCEIMRVCLPGIYSHAITCGPNYPDQPLEAGKKQI